jgi:hypothetical protein
MIRGARQYDWRDLATLHRPRDAELLAREARRLHADGLKPRDVSAALKLPLGDVLAAIVAKDST